VKEKKAMKRTRKTCLSLLLTLTIAFTSASFALLPGTGARYNTDFDNFEGSRILYSYVWMFWQQNAGRDATDVFHTWTVPVTGWYGFVLIGGQGGLSAHANHNAVMMPAGVDGGLGGVATGAIHLNAGEQLRILIGRGGYTHTGTNAVTTFFRGGWSQSHGGSGGGLSMIFRGTIPALPAAGNNTPTAAQITQLDAIAVAGGGGGASRGNNVSGSTIGQHRSGGAGGNQNGPGIAAGARGEDTSGNNGAGGNDAPAGTVTGAGRNSGWLTGGDRQGGGGWVGSGGAGWFGGNGNPNATGNASRPGGGGSTMVVDTAVALPAAILGVGANGVNGPFNGLATAPRQPRANPAHTGYFRTADGSAAIVFLGTQNPSTVTDWWF